MEFIPEITLAATIISIVVLLMQPVKSYIRINTKKIFIERDYSNEEVEYVCFNVRCNDMNFIKHFEKDIPVPLNLLEMIGIIIGIIYINKNGGFRFEDRLVVKRFVENHQETFSNDSKESKGKIEYIIEQNIIIPFVTQPWIIEGDNSDYIEILDLVKEHYDLCNAQSMKRQILLKYSRNEHHKFALMDQMIRLSEYINYTDSCDGANIDGILNSDYIYSINIMKKSGVIEDPNGVETDCKLTYSGHRAIEFGFDQACEYNRNKRNEKWLDVKSNILPIIISATALIVSFVSLVRSFYFP